MDNRKVVLNKVTEQIIALCSDQKIIKVAIDGVDGAGKSFFAEELVDLLESKEQKVIHTSVDVFHHPREIRYRLGKDSPEGFFEDSYNYTELIECLLKPLSSDGNRQYRRAAFDHRKNVPIHAPVEVAKLGSILIMDGIFLHRSEIREYWDYSVFLDVSFEVSVPRGNQRFGGSFDPEDQSNRRYVEGQKLYLKKCEPKKHASVIINNEALDSPYIVEV